MRRWLAGLCMLGLLWGEQVEAAPPKKLEGIKLGWRAKATLRKAKKRGWRLQKSKRMSCRRRSITFKKSRGRLLLVTLYRGRVFAVVKMLHATRGPAYTLYSWKKRLRRYVRRYGKFKLKMIPFGRVYAGWYRWISRSRWFSIAVNTTRTRPLIVRPKIFNLKRRRMDKRMQRCLKRRRR